MLGEGRPTGLHRVSPHSQSGALGMYAHGETPFRWPGGHGFVVGCELPLPSSYGAEFRLRKFALPKPHFGSEEKTGPQRAQQCTPHRGICRAPLGLGIFEREIPGLRSCVAALGMPSAELQTTFTCSPACAPLTAWRT
jgi:hypothetical protein